jgi:glycosyltransferase involved in cell wall biosynthesis
MHIAFIDITTAYSAASPFEGPLGGTQAAVCYLGAELVKAGVSVTLINQRREAGTVHGVHNLPPEKLDDAAALAPFTHIIFNGRWTEKMVRSMHARSSARFIGWMHEACFQSPYILPLAEFNDLIFVSAWQKNLNAALIPATVQAHVMPNGIAPGFHTIPLSSSSRAKHSEDPGSNTLEEADLDPRLRGDEGGIAIYSGSSKRGLLHLPEILPLIHAAHPDMQFEIYSDSVIAASEEENRAFREKLSALPGVTHVGAVDQDSLAMQLARATYLLSPNAYPETFCIAIAEGLAAGLRVIATARAAIPETCAGFAALMPFDHPDDPGWRPQDLSPQRFAAFANQEIAAWRGRNNDTALNRQVADARARFSWAQHAQSWVKMLAR